MTTEGAKISIEGDGDINVPDTPVIPFIEGDGTGPDIWAATQPVLDTAVQEAYGGARSIAWKPVLAGEAAHKATGEWLPEATVDAFREFVVGIKGPLTTPIGGGIRSLNVALRQKLDLYACIRPVYHVPGVPSPVNRPQDMDLVIFRENTEDVYAGVEFEPGSAEAGRLRSFLVNEMGVDAGKFRGDNVGLGIKPVSEEGSKRLIRKALKYAVAQDRSSVTLVHKGNIMKFTEGKFVDWGYELARDEFDARPLDGGPWHVFDSPKTGEEIVVKDVIADNMFQQLLTRTTNYSVVATTNLNGDYLSDAAAGQVGGLGMAPGGNIGDGLALFEATHGTAPKYAGQDKVNPGSLILSGVSMLEYLGWQEAAELALEAMGTTIEAKVVTYDLARQLEGVDAVPTSVFGQAVCAAIRGEEPASVVD